MKVINEIRVYEKDGEGVKIGSLEDLTIQSHWNRKDLVVIITPDGKAYTVVGEELKCAISNAQNTTD